MEVKTERRICRMEMSPLFVDNVVDSMPVLTGGFSSQLGHNQGFDALAL
jgi:hypothetical protein